MRNFRFNPNLAKNFKNIFLTKIMNKATTNKKGTTKETKPTSKRASILADILKNTTTNFEILETPIKSESDKKEYKVIRLENGLTACLISDVPHINDLCFSDDDDDDEDSEVDESQSESEYSYEEDESEDDISEGYDDGPKSKTVEQKMAAAALCIGVGSFSDPKDIPGMAHFLEHMVFMGSEKYPEENDFDSFITKRGGSDNACTDCEMTTFYFECLEKDLLQGLDKFAQFFIAPLMLRGSMTREREAVHSEFEMALPSDTNRKEQLLSSLAKSDSPVNTFTWGNLTTLKENVTDDELYEKVHEFRKRHYSAHRMTLAIQARLPMNVLESYVLNCFAAAPCNNLPPDNFKIYSNDVFDTPEFNRVYYVKPTHNLTQVDLTWILPSLLHKYKSKPHQYVAWLLGNEGVGSILAYLRKKIWVLNMTAGNEESGSEHNSIYAVFSVSMTLTDEGLENLHEVIESIFSYINMIKTLGAQKRIFEEIKSIEDTSFRFASEEPAADLVEDLCESMQIYPPRDYIAGSQIYSEFDPESIELVQNSLTSDRVNVMILDNNLPEGLTYNKQEKWFKTEYTDIEIPEIVLENWRNPKTIPELSIPPPNQFLTTNFTILPQTSNHPDYPVQILKNSLVELWYRKDQKFNLPIAYYNFYIINPLCLETPLSFALMDMFVNLLVIHLVEEAYPAQVAELSYKFIPSDKGITIKISGYNEKLPILIELITKYIKTFSSNLNENIFQAIKKKLARNHYNTILKPNSIAKDMRLKLILDKHHTLVEKYNAILKLSYNDMKTFSEKFIEKLYVKALVQGNVTEDVALSVIEKFVSTLNYKPLEPDTYPKFRVIEIPKGEHCCQVESFNNKDSNSIITNYYQSTPFTIKNSVIIEIIMLLIHEPLFDILRTKEQLGYQVYCSVRETYGILGFTITVNAQATKNTTKYVDERIEEFIKRMSNMFNTMTEKSFNETKKDLIKMKHCVDVHLKEEVNRNWIEIAEDDYLFDRLKQELQVIEQLEINDIRNWWQEHNFCGNQNNFRKLSIQVVGFNINEETVEKVGDENDSTDLLKEVNLKYLGNEILENKSDNYFIQNVGEFKKDLFLHPVTFKCT